MKISKKDALTWFRFFAELPENEPLGCRQQEIALAVFAQIETAVELRRTEILKTIPALKAIVPGVGEAVPWSPGHPFCTLFVGPEEHFRSAGKAYRNLLCLSGTLHGNRKILRHHPPLP